VVQYFLRMCKALVQLTALHGPEQKEIFLKNEKMAGHLWLTPVILATQEVEIRRIKV
jgi:hypothetical protein